MVLRIGLDFGTSNSGVAISDGKQVKILPIDQGNVQPEVVKTILYITRDHKAYIGQEAVELYYRHNVNRLRRYVKKFAGELEFHGSELHYIRDIFVWVDELKPGRLLQYLKTTLRQTGSARGYEGTQVFDRFYTVADLLEAYLSALKQRSEDYIGESINEVVIGRPVRFSEDVTIDQQAQETLRQAAHQAGFKRVDFELEPVAAALFYEQTLEQPQNALIFDFGGGTLDLAIMRLGDPQKRHVYACGGIGIAGSDFDRAIITKRLLPHFGLGKIQHQPQLMELIQVVPDWIALPELSTPLNRQNLENAIQAGIAPARLKTLQSMIFNDLAFTFYNQVESSKIALSNQGVTVISIDAGGIDLWELYTRAQFESDINSYQEQIERVILNTVEESGLETEQIDVVVKTGGSSNIPAFTAMLERIFSPERVIESNTFSSVVAGLAIRAKEGGIKG